MNKKSNPEVCKQIIEMYNSGDFNVKEITKEMGFCKQTVSKILKSNGIRIKRHKKLCKLNKQQEQEIVKLYTTEIISCTKIATLYNVSHVTISKTLKKYNIPLHQDDSLFSRKYAVNINYFDDIDTEEKAYFLGLLCADGCNQPKVNKVSLALAQEDIELVEKFKTAIKTDAPIGIFKPHAKCQLKAQNMACLSIYNKHFSKNLSELGCVYWKTFNLEFPTKLSKSDLFKHYIRGYIDGNGTFNIKDKTLNLALISTKMFCEGLQQFLLNKFNIKSSVRLQGLTEGNDISSIFTLTSKSTILEFLDWIYKDSVVYLNRKYVIYLKIKEIYP